MYRLVVKNKTINLIKLLFKLKPEIYSWQICINVFITLPIQKNAIAYFFKN